MPWAPGSWNSCALRWCRPPFVHDRTGGSMGLVDEAEFHYFHFFPYTNLPEQPQRPRVALGRLPEQQLRPEARQRALQPVPRRDGAGRQARLRRHRAERAPQHPVHDEPRAEPHRGGAHPPDEGLDQRVRHAAELRVPEPPGRGVRHARRDVGRAAPGRLPARHGHGVLGQRGQPGDRASPLPRVARRSSCKCWTEDGPQSYAGDFYTYRYLNPWPKPVQKPHPECYIVGTGSPETIELAAELGFGYSVVFIPTEVQLRVFDQYRERLAGARARGRLPTR